MKAKPEFHKKLFLKLSHQSPLFCALYHKVHLPKELNNYKFLRGQNHYDSYHLSGVSVHGVSSFYYPARAIHKCSSCHMPPVVSGDFGARNINESVLTKACDHQFAGANTAIPYLTRMPNCVNQKQKRFLKRAARIGIFGLREAGAITGALLASLGSAAMMES